MRLIFMGSPDFAVPSLTALHQAGHEIVGVYTHPDKQTGRGKKIAFPPVKDKALELGLPVFQPKSLKRQSVLDEMALLQADAIVVAAYGKILPPAVLSMTKYGCFNVHASLLPEFRGAAPVEWAILSGKDKTGITIMQMNEGLDTGDILSQVVVPIEEDDTGDTLTDKLSKAGTEILLTTLKDAEEGRLEPVKQPEESPTPYAAMLSKEMGRMDFSDDAATALLKIRAFNSWPSAYTSVNGKALKIFKAALAEGREDRAEGEIIEVTKKDFTVNFRSGALRILSLQPEGKKAMDTDAYLRGTRLTEGMRLG